MVQILIESSQKAFDLLLGVQMAVLLLLLLLLLLLSESKDLTTTSFSLHAFIVLFSRGDGR